MLNVQNNGAVRLENLRLVNPRKRGSGERTAVYLAEIGADQAMELTKAFKKRDGSPLTAADFVNKNGNTWIRLNVDDDISQKMADAKFPARTNHVDIYVDRVAITENGDELLGAYTIIGTAVGVGDLVRVNAALEPEGSLTVTYQAARQPFNGAAAASVGQAEGAAAASKPLGRFLSQRVTAG